MKKLAAIILGLGLAFCSSAAVQVTKQYCDANAERAVTNSLQAAREYIPTVAIPIIGNVVTNYLLEEGRVITNVTYDIRYIIETNSTHYIWSTNYTTMVEEINGETNTMFKVNMAGELSIEKDGDEVWRESKGMSPEQTREYVNNYVDPKIAAQNQIIATWEGFLDGSNVVFSITNYLSGSYNLDWAKLRILELRDGEYREVYNSHDEIVLHINALSNNVTGMVEGQLEPIRDELAQKGDAAWGRRSSTGQPVPISNTVWVTEQSLRISGGMEYERVAVGEGSIFVLTSKGQSSYVQGDEGSLLLHDDGSTNYFGMVKSDSYTVGCNTDEISVQNQMVTLGYNLDMPSGSCPCIWYMPALENYDPTAWEQLNTADGEPVSGASHLVVWEPAGVDMHRECHINVTGEPKGFFRATIEVSGVAKFKTNMSVDAPTYVTSDGNHKVIIDWNGGNPKLTPVNE